MAMRFATTALVFCAFLSAFSVQKTFAQMFFCFESFAEGRCVGNLLGAVSTPEECCLIPDRGGLGGGGFVESGNEDCTSCMTEIQFLFAAVSVPEEDMDMDIDVELIAIDGGGVFLDGGEIRARIITMEGTATSPDDYIDRTPMNITFSVGSAIMSIQSPFLTTIVEDAMAEPDETFRAIILPSDPSQGDTDNFVIGALSTAIITIIDDDSDITIGLPPGVTNINEGDQEMICATITSGSTVGRTFVLDYVSVNGDAIGGVDFTPASGSLTFNDGVGSSVCFTVQTTEDGSNEGLECFSINLSTTEMDPSLTIAPASTVVCIVDDVSAVVSPSFSVGGTRFEFPENDGVAAACFQATNVDESFTVGYRTEDLNPPDATDGVDYNGAMGTLFFSSTTTTACVPIDIIGDGSPEGTECFNIVLVNTAGANVILSQPVTSVCIIDNDVVRIFAFTEPAYAVIENIAPAPFQVCVILLQGILALGETTTFQLTTTQGTATNGVDYDDIIADLVFTFNNQDQTLCGPITIMNNLDPEPDETFEARIRNTAGNIAFQVVAEVAIVTILDDDEELPTIGGPGPGIGDDPHFAIYLPSGKLLCYTVQGEHSFAFNLISNDKISMNALFVPDSRREEVTWIGSLGIVVQNTHFQGSNTTRLQFDSKVNKIHINNKVTLEAKNIDKITFHNGKLIISEGPMIEGFHYPSVRVNLDDLGMQFTVNFTGEHLDMMWNKLEENHNSHGLIGQFFREGVEIDVPKKLLLLPGKNPVPVMRKPVWAYMEHNVPSDQLCWVAMNPGYQGKNLIDGHYLDYVVDNVLSTDFKFECKHKN